MRNKKKIVISLLTVVFLLVLFCVWFISNSLGPVSSSSAIRIFTIAENTSTKEVLNKLEEQQLIKNGDIAYLYVRIFHPTSFYAGTYELDASWNTTTIVDHLSNEDNVLHDTVSITFIEGEWLKHYAEKIEEVTIVTADELIAYWNDEETVRSLMSEYPFLTEAIFNGKSRYLLEGYLFPDTYEFYIETTPEAITRTFLDRTLKYYTEHQNDFDKAELPVHEIFTLASIVQYEASSYSDMQKVAGVFYNRLNSNMPLGSSVTICYAIDLEKGDSWKECEYNPNVDSPYNTYINLGLPPGPILNPGASALDAALKPAKHNYYYFMADVCGDGQVYYAETYSEHEANIAKYLTCY